MTKITISQVDNGHFFIVLRAGRMILAERYARSPADVWDIVSFLSDYVRKERREAPSVVNETHLDWPAEFGVQEC